MKALVAVRGLSCIWELTMAEWIEIPAHRILKVPLNEYRTDFREIADEQTPGFIYRIVRIRDSKVFQIPRWHEFRVDCGNVICLEEI